MSNWGYVIYSTKGRIIFSSFGFSSREDAMKAGIEYINANDIWDCRVETEFR